MVPNGPWAKWPMVAKILKVQKIFRNRVALLPVLNGNGLQWHAVAHSQRCPDVLGLIFLTNILRRITILIRNLYSLLLLKKFTTKNRLVKCNIFQTKFLPQKNTYFFLPSVIYLFFGIWNSSMKEVR